MRKQRRDRKRKSIDEQRKMQRMSETKPNDKASEIFHRKPYQSCSVIDYLEKRADIKRGVEADGQGSPK